MNLLGQRWTMCSRGSMLQYIRYRDGRILPFREIHSGKQRDSGLSTHVAQASLPDLVSDINHYLRTTEMADNLRRKLLRAKCDELLVYGQKNGVSIDYFRTLNRVFVHTRQEIDSIFSGVQLHELFNSAVQYYLGRNRTVPQFVHLLAADFVRHPEKCPFYPTMTLVNIVRLGTFLRDFGTSFSHINRFPLPPDFLSMLLAEMKANNELKLADFKTVLKTDYVSDDLAYGFVQYVEDLFNERNPNIHEYLDKERDVAYVQETMNEMISHDYSVDANVALLVLKTTMNTVCCCVQDNQSVAELFRRIAESGSRLNLAERNLDVLLLEAAKNVAQYPEFSRSVCDQILEGEFSEEAVAKAEVVRILTESGNSSSHAESLQNLFGRCGDLSNVFTFMVQGMCCVQYPQIIENVENIRRKLHHEYSLDDYKYLIGHVMLSNPNQAFQLFETSTNSINWRDSIDPSVPHTLNGLILSLAEKEHLSLEELFRRFKKIKQNHPSVCDAQTLHGLCKRMLEEQCVGDVIELLKRELPKVEKDSIQKLQVQESYHHHNRQLFDLLHDFVLTYDQEKTYEVNWVLYGELHKYFQFPHESYLPVMQFFCRKNRLNAALLICRRMKMLSELHGAQNPNRPPSRDIYIYLFEVFGDNLYEEGVVEVHEFLKMDTVMESQDIELQNCLLNAYCNLQEVGKAHDLFLAISANSKENGGLNERTAQIMIKTFTYSDITYVKQFWNSLSEYGVFPTHDIFKQYLIAHAYYGLVEQAKELAKQADEYNLVFSSDMLLAMHNYCLDAGKQEEVAQWAMETYPKEWAKVKESGALITASGYMPDGLLFEGTRESAIEGQP